MIPRVVVHLRIGVRADDLLDLIKYLEIPGAVLGGISMGAAIALVFALRCPAKALGLVLSRPASLDCPNPFNQKMFALIAEFIKTAGPEEGLRVFQELPEFKEIEHEFPDTANSLSNQFKHPRAREMTTNLSRIPNDWPLNDIAQARSIACPTLILANKNDPIHPYEYGVRLAKAIPGAQFREIASKSVDLNQHLRDVQQFIHEFLSQTFLSVPK